MFLGGGVHTLGFYRQTDDQLYSQNGKVCASETKLPFTLSELPEPPIPVSEIGPIPPPPMFSTPSPLPPQRNHFQNQREQMTQQREREQNLAAAIAMVVQNATRNNVENAYNPSHGI